MGTYSNNLFLAHKEGSLASAREIVPLVISLMSPRFPTSVIDIGCGTGTWLAVFKDHGVPEVYGLDGDWVSPDLLMIPKENFLSADLTRPLELDRTFDLVVSLEVAEHLEGQYAQTFIDSLTRLGPVVLFSAAIPQQGGTHHVNEQWPEYWKDLFSQKGFVAIDCLRKKVWNMPEVDFWYAQNIMFFVEEGRVGEYQQLNLAYNSMDFVPLSLVHPGMFLHKVDILNRTQDLDPILISVRRVLRKLPTLMCAALRRKLREMKNRNI